MVEQPKVVKALYIRLLQDLLAKRAAATAMPSDYTRSGLYEYLSQYTELREAQKAAIQLGLLLVYYRTRGHIKTQLAYAHIANRSMLGMLRDYHNVCRVSAPRQAELLEVTWAQIIADLRAIPADELTAILLAYYSKAKTAYTGGLIPSLAETFAHKPDAVALKRLSPPANGHTTFTKRIMKIVGEK